MTQVKGNEDEEVGDTTWFKTDVHNYFVDQILFSSQE